MACHPNHFAHIDLRKIGGYIGAYTDHGIRINIRHIIGLVDSTAVGFGSVTIPTPKQGLNEAHAIETEGISRCGFDFDSSYRLSVVAVVGTVSFLILSIQGRTDTTHDIQGFVIFRNFL